MLSYSQASTTVQSLQGAGGEGGMWILYIFQRRKKVVHNCELELAHYRELFFVVNYLSTILSLNLFIIVNLN